MFSRNNEFNQRVIVSILLLSTLGLGGCGRESKVYVPSPTPTPAVTPAVTKDVRAFADAVAADVTKRGVVAWQDHFSDVPAFFMAVDGRLVFTNRDDATKQIPEIATNTARIELKWGEPMLIDPISADLAMVASPYHETIVDPKGETVEEYGYFTGLAERRPTGWKFRDAHWSTIQPTDEQPSK
jgi:hypothetical protein